MRKDTSTWCMVGAQSVHLHENVDTAGTQSRHPQEDGAVIGTVLSSPSAPMHPHARTEPHTHTHTHVHACTQHTHVYTHMPHICACHGHGYSAHMCADTYIYTLPIPHLCEHVCTCAHTMQVYLCEHIHAHRHTLRNPVPGPGATQQEVD